MTWRTGRLGAAWAVLLAGGCTPYARLSSGQVGCPAAEIQTSNEVEGAYGVPTTWTAKCQGRVYYCTMTTGHGNYGSTSCSSASKSSGSDYDFSDVPPDPVVAARSEAPGKAAGFDFGASAEQAAQVCTSAGGRWEDGASEVGCSKPPLGVGFDGRVALTLCGGRVCAVKIARDAPDAEADALRGIFIRVAGALQAKYGKPDRATIKVPSLCADLLASCLRTQQAKVAAEWNWPSQHTVALLLAPRPEGVSLVLEYRAPKRVGGSLDGL